MSLFNQIAEIVRDAQRNSATHARGVIRLKAICQEEKGSAAFKLNLKKCIHAFLRKDHKIPNPFVNRGSNFIAMFCLQLQEHHSKNVDEDTDDPVVSSIVSFLIEMSQTDPDSVRYRSCQFIGDILTMLVGLSLEEEICDQLQDAMLLCLQDRVIRTRVQAAHVLAPLQDNSSNSDCPVINAFIEHLKWDSSAQVRRTCTNKVALNRKTVPEVVLASTDIDASVRLEVYRKALKFPSQFKIINKQQLIKTGFNDTSAIIKKFIAGELVPAWLAHFEFNYLRLLNSLRLDSNWDDLFDTLEVDEYALNTLFQVRQTSELLQVLKFDENKLLPLQDINWDSVIYWRVFISHLRKMNPDDVDVDDYIPDIPLFCAYIEDFCKHAMEKLSSSQDQAYKLLEFNFALSQLFAIANNFDYSDITCQRCTNEMIANLFKSYNLDFEVLIAMIGTLNKSMPDLKRQSEYICDLLGDMLCPSLPAQFVPQQTSKNSTALTANATAEIESNDELNSTQQQYMLAQLKIAFHSLTSQLCDAVAREDYAAASVLKEEVKAKKAEIEAFQAPKRVAVVQESIAEEPEVENNDLEDGGEVSEREEDPVIVTRALNIMAAFLKSSKLRNLPTNIIAFKMNHIDEMTLSSNWHIRLAALKCLALCCTLDERTAQTSIGIFCGLLRKHTSNNMNTLPFELMYYSAGAIIDALLAFGPNLFANVPEGTMLSTSTNEEEQDVLSGGFSLSAMIRELLHLLNDEHPKLQEIAGVGICNLVLTSRVHSHAVLSRLILKYVSPTARETPVIRLQQYIGVLLQRIPRVPNSASQFTRAIVPVIKIIVKAPVSSPLQVVDLEATSKLLIKMCTTFNERNEMQMELAEELLTEFKKKPNSRESLTFSQMLLMLEFDAAKKEKIQEYVDIIQNLRNETCDKKIEANLIKLNSKLTLSIQGGSDVALPAIEENEDGDENQSSSD